MASAEGFGSKNQELGLRGLSFRDCRVYGQGFRVPGPATDSYQISDASKDCFSMMMGLSM